MYEKTFDAVFRDTAIIANRSEYEEFTQPYSSLGLQVLMYFKPKRIVIGQKCIDPL